jgi:phosphatidylserine/phosphatidylglycerophosphate/cardiolipin synthase-like enzyme
MSGARMPLASVALATAFGAVHRRVLGIPRRPCWPPSPDAVTSAGAQAATEAFCARRATGPHDAALEFAWSTAATVEPWVEGATFFPRIFADVAAARSSVHILMFGWREGAIGTRLAALLQRRLVEGVEVRVIGSAPSRTARHEPCSRG